MRRLAAAAALALALPAAGVHAARDAAADLHDLGDAPDAAPAGYAARPDVSGAYPSTASSRGPRHRAGGVRLGAGWTREPRSLQVDRDSDDGAMLELRRRGSSTLTLVIDGRRLPRAAFAPAAATRIWVNAWFDWNQDGDWNDGAAASGAPEWGVQNLALAPRALGSARIATIRVRVRTGAVPDELWWRAQVHVGERAPHHGGAGGVSPYAHGETEDYFHRTSLAAKPPPSGGATLPSLVCGRRPIVEHGRQGFVTAAVAGVSRAPAGGHVLERPRVLRVSGATDGVSVSRSGFDLADGWVRAKVASGRRHARRPLLQELTVHFGATAITAEGVRVALRTACRVLVDHAPTLARQAPQPQAGAAAPPPRAGGGEGGGEQQRADPATAGCRARVALSGTARVSLRCDGVDVRSSSAFTTLATITSVREVGSRASACRVEAQARVARCLWRAPNRRAVLVYEYAAERDVRSVRLYALAGGPAGTIGSTVVLLQDWALGSRGLTCVQSVPKAPSCATLP